MMTYPQKITFGEMRSSGVRDVLVYCRDHRCSHSTTISADRWPDNIRLSDVEPGFICICTACGKRGADQDKEDDRGSHGHRPGGSQVRFGNETPSFQRRQIDRSVHF